MNGKGYQHPLFSLDLLGPQQDFPDESIYSIPVPEGLLVVSKALRKRATCITTSDTWDAIGKALGTHVLWMEGLTRYGLGQDWTQSLTYWGERLLALERDCGRVSVRIQEVQKARRELKQTAVVLWRQLALTAQLARVADPVPRVRPQDEQGLRTGLTYALKRLGEPEYAPLSARGFGLEEQALLRRVVNELRTLPEQELDGLEERHKIRAMILVIRGALVGDLIYLSKAARMVVNPIEARRVQVQELLGI